MKVWIAKYVVTRGVFSEEVEKTGSPTMVKSKRPGLAAYYHKNDWFKTKEEADQRAAQIVRAKLKSLDKQQQKLRDLLAELEK